MWLDRSLLLGPRLALVATERQFNAVKKSAGLPLNDGPLLEGAMHACVHSYTDGNGQLVCIVGISLAVCSRMDGVGIAALLAHEAVHVWQRMRDRLGDGDLGREMEAYAVQNIVANLMHGYQVISSSVVVRRVSS